ncbi:MAG TPA: ABC transporter substrate-binding protein [Vicinamibacteria bacterium]|nr:ABC transporter substrate-binding protein [Vicinamibacteria bacterium]
MSLAVLASACAGPAPLRPPLRIAIYDRPRSFDPHLESEFISFDVASHVYEGLTRLDRDLKVAPALAERWESPDALRWRFRLRAGVRFHDGRPLTADDVVASLERARSHPRSDWSSYLVAVDGVRALDALTVEVATRRPYSLLLQKLAYIMIVPRGEPDEIERPVGTGPYRLLAPLTGRRLILHAFEAYWGTAPTETVVHLEVEPSIEGALQRARSAESADVLLAVGPQAADLIARTPGYSLVTRSGITTDYLQLDISRPPFSDIRVRRAVSLALDRSALVRDVLGGRGRPANQLVSPAVFGHDPSVPEVLRDVPEARRLLAEAGYGAGLDLDLEYREGRRVTAIVTQLAEVGIRARPRPQPYGPLSARLRSREVAMYYGGAMASTGDASDLLDSLLHSRTPERGLGENNSIGYRNLVLDGLIEAASRQSAMAERRATLQRCLRIALEDLPLVPLVSPEDIYGVREGIEWRPRLDGRVLGAEVRRAARAGAVAERRSVLLE